MRRFIGEPDPTTPSTVLLQGTEARHACAVLRLKEGDNIQVLSGGREYECTITEISPSLVRAKVLAEAPPAPSAIKIILAQGLAKGSKMDEIIRMACELGVFAIIPLLSGRVATPGADANALGRLERWRAIAQSAVKVSGGASPSQILPPMSIAQLAAYPHGELKIAFWEREETSLKSVLGKSGEPASILIVIGPEGGLAEEEVAQLRSAGFVTASLGGRILRTQTAGAAAAISILYHFS